MPTVDTHSMERKGMQRRVGLAALLTLLAACNGTETGSETAAAQAQIPAQRSGIALTDTHIAELLYAGTPRVPTDFFSDAPPPGSGVVSTYHLQNTQLSPATARYELCTDDMAQARNWSNTVSGSAETLVGESALDRYFEFQRVRNGIPMVTVRARVFRCTYLDRSGVNLADMQGSAGRMNLRPIDAAALRTLSEYLWTFSTFNNADYAVLASRGAQQNASLEHEIVMAQLIRVGSGGCDRISVSTWRHRLELAPGTLGREWIPLWEFGARQQSGSVTTC
jgi:hypothetical protein